MATPPTRVLAAQPSTGNFTTSTSPKTTTAFDVTAGDLIVVTASVENAVGPTAGAGPSASGGSVTWTLRASQNGGTSNQSAAYCWTGAVGASATGITVSMPRPTSTTTLHWGFVVSLWRAHGGVGTTFSGNNGTGAGAPSQAGAASCAANSAVACGINDWNAGSGARTWRTINGAAETESYFVNDGSVHSAMGGYRLDTGAAGAITQGLTAPTTLRWVLVGVEILGTAGAAAAQPPVIRRPLNGLIAR